MAKKKVSRKAKIKINSPKLNNKKFNKEIRKDLKDEKIMAFIATFLSIIGFIIVLFSNKSKRDYYVTHYAKQSLVVFVSAFVAFLIGKIALFIPIIGRGIDFILNIVILVLWILSWVYALSGKVKYVPVVGKYGDYVDL